MLGSVRSKSFEITVGELCEAIEGGRLPVRQRGKWYSIKRRHLVKYVARVIAERVEGQLAKVC